MKTSEIIQILTKAIPREIEWSRGEVYGAYGTVPDKEVQRVLFCVTPTHEVVQRFNDENYDLLISHHPFVIRGIPHLIFHTAMDCCEGGLNDQWRDALQVKNAKHFDGTLGWYGQIDPISFIDLVAKCEAFMCQKSIGQLYSKKKIIESVVICTGLGGMVTRLAAATKADCYILGEATEHAKTMGFAAVIETGHTISEQMGVVLIRNLLPGVIVDLATLEEDYFGRECFSRKAPG